MAHLRGSSESAEQLRREIYGATEELKNLVVSESRSLVTLSESCCDNSYTVMEYVVRQILLDIQIVMAALAVVCKRLQAYRDLIESLDSTSFDAVSSALEAKGYDKITQAKWIVCFQNAMVKQYGEKWSASLSAKQKEAVRSYTGSSYSDINATLRGLTDGFISEDNKNYAIQIHRALEECKIPCECIVYRGMKSVALGSLQNLSDQELVGKVYTDNGFLSTSLSSEDSFGGNIQLEIEVPKGAKGAYVGYISQQGHAESEVLFDRGQYMRILSVERDRYGNRRIRARIMS